MVGNTHLFQRGFRRHQDDRGFTLVELMVVVLVISVLIAIAIPTFTGARTRAQNRTAQANLVTASKAQAALAANIDAYTDVAVDLATEEPSFDWSGAADDSIHVVLGDILPGDHRQVLLYSKSGSGNWYGIKLVRADGAGVSAGRYTCEGTAESEIDELVECTGNSW